MKENKVQELPSFKRNICVLMDEMKLKSGLFFTSSGKLVGFSDLGPVNNELQKFEQGLRTQEAKLASHVFVLMAKGLFSGLKFPFAYYPCEGMTSEQTVRLWIIICLFIINQKSDIFVILFNVFSNLSGRTSRRPWRKDGSSTRCPAHRDHRRCCWGRHWGRNAWYLASHVFVLMARGLFSGLKLPFAYYPRDGMTSEQLYTCVWGGIQVLECWGLKVRAITSDGASNNRTFYNLCANDGNSHWTLNPYDTGRREYFFSDPPHLVKTVRNNLANRGSHTKTRNLMVNFL